MKIKFINKFQYSALFVIFFVFIALLTTGCNQNNTDNNLAPAKSKAYKQVAPPESARSMRNTPENPEETASKQRKDAYKNMVDLNVELEENFGKMITYEVASTGRSNPFMPYSEEMEYRNARASAIKEANARNSQIIQIKNMQNYRVREQDDISPYSFNLPVPPTASGPAGSPASTITKTKVVGIMYNEKSPTAIINIDNKDYLVRPGDKIIGQEYIVTKINPAWVTAAMGANVYSASIGELFSKDGIQENQTDIYDLKNRFGGRKI